MGSEIEMAEDGGLEAANEIGLCIQDLVHEEANIIFGAKFAAGLPSNQSHVHLIFQIQNSPLQNEPPEKDACPPNTNWRREPKEESDDDLFSEIEKIFERARR